MAPGWKEVKKYLEKGVKKEIKKKGFYKFIWHLSSFHGCTYEVI
jgi:hypothetical protein